jgi:hypothetical protein
MLDRAAEQSFQKGLELFQVNDTGIQTLALFEAALTSDRRSGNKKGEARYRSYFGLCMVLRGENMREGLALCRQAASQEFYNPQMWLNLGRAETTAGHRRRAHRAFVRGVRLAPENSELRAELKRLGMRRPPVLGFLHRDHWLNKWLGKLTWRWFHEGRESNR